MSLIPNKALKEGKKCWTDFMSVLRGEMENVEMKQRKVGAHVQCIPSRTGWEMRKQRGVAAGLRRFYSFSKYLPCATMPGLVLDVGVQGCLRHDS